MTHKASMPIEKYVGQKSLANINVFSDLKEKCQFLQDENNKLKAKVSYYEWGSQNTSFLLLLSEYEFKTIKAIIRLL